MFSRKVDDAKRTRKQQSRYGPPQGSSAHANREKQGERLSQPQQAKGEIAVEDIVRGLIAEDPSCGWLAGEDPRAIRKVINTVRAARAKAKAKAKGEELSDRDIYLRYRKAIDKGEQNGKSTADPELVRSFQILNAMMGGKVSGKLPAFEKEKS